jgi:hypothetical protein
LKQSDSERGCARTEDSVAFYYPRHMGSSKDAYEGFQHTGPRAEQINTVSADRFSILEFMTSKAVQISITPTEAVRTVSYINIHLFSRSTEFPMHNFSSTRESQ